MAEDVFISRETAQGDLLSAATFIGERIKSADGHAEAMRVIVPMHLAKGDVDLAAELANQVDEPFSRDKLLTLIAIKCAEVDDDEYAMQLADAIEDEGLRSQAHESVAIVKCNKDQFDKAREIAGTMFNPDFVYAGIAIGEARVGNSEASDQALSDTAFASARVFALQSIAAGAVEKGENARAVTALDRALEAAAEIEHDEERIRAYCDIGNLFIDAKRNDKAIATYDKAREEAEQLDNIHRDNFFGTCALGFLLAGSEELCDRALDLVTDKTQMASALLGMARFEWQHEKTVDAGETLDEAFEILKSQRDVETRDRRATNALMASIALQLASFGKPDRGIEAAKACDDPDETTNALSQIAQVLTIQKKDDLARQAMTEIPEDAGRLICLIGMADAKLRLKETDAAVALLEEAATMTDAVPQLASRSNALNEIADRLFEQGMLERAREVAVENLGIICEIRDESSQAVALVGLASIYSSRGIEIGESETAIVKGLVDKID